MRRNQLNLTITRFGEAVPDAYPEDTQIIHVYADDNNLYAALTKLFATAVNEIAEWERINVRTDISNNAYGDITAKILGRKYSENNDLEYTKKRLQMDKELLGYIENSTKILDVIKNSRDQKDVRKNLEEKLGYTQNEIASILRLRFDSFTQDEVDAIKEEIKKLESILDK